MTLFWRMSAINDLKHYRECREVAKDVGSNRHTLFRQKLEKGHLDVLDHGQVTMLMSSLYPWASRQLFSTSFKSQHSNSKLVCCLSNKYDQIYPTAIQKLLTVFVSLTVSQQNYSPPFSRLSCAGPKTLHPVSQGFAKTLHCTLSYNLEL